MSTILEQLTEEEAYLYALLQDHSGIDIAEFCLLDEEFEDGLVRAFPLQVSWWRDSSKHQIDQGCFAGETKVLTSNGWVSIKDIQIGDRVLTHKNRWKTVTNVFDRGVKDVVSVNPYGHPSSVLATPDHRFWASKVRRSSLPKDGHRKKKLGEGEWVRLQDWEWNDGSSVMTTNVASPSYVEPLEMDRYLETAYASGQQNYLKDTLSNDWMFLYGLYIAEGSTYTDDQYSNSIWSLHRNEIDEITPYFDRLNLNYSVHYSKTDKSAQIQIHSRPLGEWLVRNAGVGSKNKKIAPWVLGLPREYRQSIFDGMIYGDGCRRGNGRVEYSTISIDLIFSLRILASSLDMSFTASEVQPQENAYIGDRKINGGLSYIAGMESIEGQKRSRATIRDGHIWSALNSIEDAGQAHVYDLEVEDDHSFVVEGLVAHNSRSVGKALDIDTLILTTSGWKTMETVKVGDVVFNEKAEHETITDVYDIMYHRPCFELTTSEGESVVADMDHGWVTLTKDEIKDRSPDIKGKYHTTYEIYKSLFTDDGEPRHYLPKVSVVSGMLRAWNRDYVAITDVKLVESRPVRCISVTGESRQFLAGKGLIPTHNSMSIRYRCVAFPFIHPGAEMLITAPEGVHLNAITSKIDAIYRNNRIPREMIARRGSQLKMGGRPWELQFKHGGKIHSRLPHHDGAGVKGCIAGGAIVPTRNKGLIPIEEVQDGDEVWTHENRWMPVLDAQSFEAGDCWELKGQGSFPTICTDGHRVFVRNDESKDPGKTKKILGDPHFEYVTSFEEAKNSKINAYWSQPVFADDGSVPMAPIDENLGEKHFEVDEDFMWLVGRFLADGYTSKTVLDNGDISRGRVLWIVHPKDQSDLITRFDRLGFHYSIKERDHSSADQISFCSTALVDWLDSQFGTGATSKTLPTWALFMNEDLKRALFDGYVSGDGHVSGEKIEVSSASKSLIVGIGHIATSLGYSVSFSSIQPKVDSINGVKLKSTPKRSYRLKMHTNGNRDSSNSLYASYKIKEANPIDGRHVVYNLVTDDHSYVADGVIHSNTHPTWLELDEAQDYPEPGWTEVNSTLAKVDGAVWRAHGVTRGIGGTFDSHCQPGSGWTVHRLPAMLRPTWDDEERTEAIMKYGSEENIDFKRNVLGSPGDASAVLFVLNRLIRCMDQDEASDYNRDIYRLIKVDDALIEDVGDPVYLLDIPATHAAFDKIWIGMDVGMTVSPSSIMVFAEEITPIKYKRSGKRYTENKSTLRLITRILLTRVSAPDQVRIIKHIIDLYRPKAFAMDATGAGQPLVQFLQEQVRESAASPDILNIVRGYAFSENIVVDLDDTVEVEDRDPSSWKEAQVTRNVKDYSSDVLRELVDQRRLFLPYDKDLFKEFQGETWSFGKPTFDHYGRRKIYSGTPGHSLDGARMAALAYRQSGIEQIIENHENAWSAPPTFFI